MTAQAIDTGDTVHHKPSGENWVTACVIDDRLYWLGWPPGSVPVSECKLLSKAAPEVRLQYLRNMMSMNEPNDVRCSYAQQLFQPPSDDPSFLVSISLSILQDLVGKDVVARCVAAKP